MFVTNLKRTLGASILAVGTMVAGVADTASAQAPLVTSAQRSLARQFMRGDVAQSNEAQQAILAVTKEAFRSMAALDADKAAAAYRTRGAFYSSYLSQPPKDANTPQGKNALDARKTFILACRSEGNLYLANARTPARTKANIVALWSELDERGSGPTAVPASALLGDLYNLARSESQPTYLRAVAMYGLERHFGIRWPTLPDNLKTSASAAIVKIIESEPSSGLDIAAHAWLVRRAYDTLGTVRSDAAKAQALEHLTARETKPSIRLSSAEYLSKLDLSTFEEKEKIDVLVGFAYLLRQHLVTWYEVEEARLTIAAGGGGMGAGGYPGMGGGGYGGGGPGMGGMDGGGYGGGGEGGAGAYGGYGGMGGGGYGGTGGGMRSKPIDTQSWQTIAARRVANQLTQAVHLALDGKPLPENDVSPAVIKPLASAGLPIKHEVLTTELAELIDAFQVKLNDASTVTDVRGLLQAVKTPIEDIMLHVLKIDEFRERYPEIIEAEGLDEIPDVIIGDGDAGPGEGDSLPSLGGGLGDGLPAAGGPPAGGPPPGGPRPGGPGGGGPPPGGPGPGPAAGGPAAGPSGN